MMLESKGIIISNNQRPSFHLNLSYQSAEPWLTLIYRMIEDVEFFKAKLGKFEGANQLGDYLIQVIKDKAIMAPAAQPQASTESISQTNGSTELTTQVKGDEK